MLTFSEAEQYHIKVDNDNFFNPVSECLEEYVHGPDNPLTGHCLCPKLNDIFMAACFMDRKGCWEEESKKGGKPLINDPD